MSVNKRHYFDWAASWPLHEAAEEVFRTAPVTGNAGGVHTEGRQSLALIDEARENTARLLGVTTRQLVFTGSATEANNVVIQGTVLKYHEEHPGVTPNIITTKIEHDSVGKTCELLEKRGLAKVLYLEVQPDGSINEEELKALLQKEHVALVSIMLINNEVGLRLPVEKIGKIIKEKKGEEVWPRFHVDAVQALAYEEAKPETLHADIVTYSAHKIGGPKGVGFIAFQSEQSYLAPLLAGGGQEFGMRPGTENVAGIAACSAAFVAIAPHREKEAKRLRAMKIDLYNKIEKAFEDIQLNGAPIAKGAPHIINISVESCVAQELIALLDRKGCSISAGAACSVRALIPTHVVAVLHGNDRAKQSIRMSFGPGTTQEDVDALYGALQIAIPTLRGEK